MCVAGFTSEASKTVAESIYSTKHHKFTGPNLNTALFNLLSLTLYTNNSGTKVSGH